MPRSAAGPDSAVDVVDGLVRALAGACRRLADAGRPQDAGRLAAEGWALLRHTHADQAMRLDGTMHHVARAEQRLDAAQGLDGAQHPDDPQRPDAPPGPAVRTPREDTPVSTTDRVVDVRTEIPRVRHELIFETFATLPPGSAFVLVNDHDPKPLYYQLAAENAGEFSWAYLEEGPEVWRVRIGRVAAP